MPETADIQKVQDAIRGEFRTLFDKMDALNTRLDDLELWKQREEGFKEGLGSLHAEVKDLRAKVESLRASVADLRRPPRPAAWWVPWLLAVVGGALGLVALVTVVSKALLDLLEP